MFKLSDICVGFVPIEKISQHEVDIIEDSVNILFSNQYPLLVGDNMLCVVLNEQYNIFIKYYIASLVQNGTTVYVIRAMFDTKVYARYSSPSWGAYGSKPSPTMQDHTILGISRIIELGDIQSRMLEDFMLANNISINIDIIQHDTTR